MPKIRMASPAATTRAMIRGRGIESPFLLQVEKSVIAYHAAAVASHRHGTKAALGNKFPECHRSVRSGIRG